ncbi:hypothetical protein ACQPT2_16890 [Erwinia amylovora]
MNRLILFVVSGVSTFFCVSYGINHFTPERCKAEVSFVRGDDRLNMITFKSLFSGVGTVSISGVLYNRDKTAGYISETIRFSYEMKGDTYFVTSELISKSPQMTLSQSQEEKWLPSFFYEKGKSLVWNIRPVGNNASLIFSETVPLFLCEKTG